MSHLTDDVLQSVADGTLDPAARDEASSHLQSCAVCQSLLADYRMLFSGIEDLPAVEPAPRFASRVMEKIAERELQLRRGRRLAGLMLAGSVAMTFACVALAGDAAWARQLTFLSTGMLNLGQLGRACIEALAPVLFAWRAPLTFGLSAVCVPILLALHRAMAPLRQIA